MNNRTLMKHLNALVHGVFSQQAILPGEDPKEYFKLFLALYEEWMPIGESEEEAVLTIAKCMWRKRRLQKFLKAKVVMLHADRGHIFFPEEMMLRAYSELIKTAPPETLNKRPPLSDRHIEHLRQNFPKENFASHSEWVQAVDKEIHAVLLPEASRPLPKEMLLHASAEVLSEDAFKHELSMDERLDAMIDRAIKRLAQIKAVKQMLDHTSPNGRHDQSNKFHSSRPNGSAKLINHKATRAG